jgi:hypothetical protein
VKTTNEAAHEATRAEAIARIARHALALAGAWENDANEAAAITATDEAIGHRIGTMSTVEKHHAARTIADTLSREAGVTALLAVLQRPEIIRDTLQGLPWYINPAELDPAQVRGIADTLTSGDAYYRVTDTAPYYWPDAKCLALVQQWIGTEAARIEQEHKDHRAALLIAAGIELDETDEEQPEHDEPTEQQRADQWRTAARHKADRVASALIAYAYTPQCTNPAEYLPRSIQNPAGFPYTASQTFQATNTASQMTVGKRWVWRQVTIRGLQNRTSANTGTDTLGTDALSMLDRVGWRTDTQTLEMQRENVSHDSAPQTVADLMQSAQRRLAQLLAVADQWETTPPDDLREHSQTALVFSHTLSDDAYTALAELLTGAIPERTGQQVADALTIAYERSTTAKTAAIRWSGKNGVSELLADADGTPLPQRPDAIARRIRSAIAKRPQRENTNQEQPERVTICTAPGCSTRLRIDPTYCRAETPLGRIWQRTATRSTTEQRCAVHGRTEQQKRTAAMREATTRQVLARLDVAAMHQQLAYREMHADLDRLPVRPEQDLHDGAQQLPHHVQIGGAYAHAEYGAWIDPKPPRTTPVAMSQSYHDAHRVNERTGAAEAIAEREAQAAAALAEYITHRSAEMARWIAATNAMHAASQLAAKQ